MSDFTLTTSGVTGASLSGITGSGARYTVTVNTGTGSGTIRLDVTDDDTIVDAAGNKLGGTGADNGSFTTGEVYTMDRGADAVAPTVTINQAPVQTDPATSSPVQFDVVFSEPVSTFATGDVTLSGTAGATTATVTGSGRYYSVVVSGMTAGGTVIASIDAGVAPDAAGNPNTASTSTDNSVTYNRINSFTAFVVTKTADTADGVCDSDCSLREAITAANNDEGAETITFDAALTSGGPATISLGAAGSDPNVDPSALVVKGAIVIQGPTGNNGVTIARDAAATPQRLRLFYVTAAGSLTLRNLTLSGGLAKGGNGGSLAVGGGGGAGLGGAIFNNGGTVTVIQSTLTGSQAVGGNGGDSFAGPGTRAGGGGGGGIGRGRRLGHRPTIR